MVKKASWIIVAAAVAFSLFAVFAALVSGGASIDKAAELERVTFLGEYSLDGGEWAPFTEGLKIDHHHEHTLTVRGTLSREAKENETIILRVNNLLLTVRLNGKVIFVLTSGADELTRTPGNGWASFSSPGISAADTLELTVSNVYDDGSSDVFAELFGGMYIGSEAALFAQMLRDNADSAVLGLLTSVMGALLLLVAIVGFAVKLPEAKRSFALAMLILSSGVWTFTNFDYVTLIFPNSDFWIILSQVSQITIPCALAGYAMMYMKTPARAVTMAILWFAAALLSGSALAQLTGLYDYYELGTLNVCFLLASGPLILASLIYEAVKDPSKEINSFLTASAPYVAGGVAELILVLLGFSYRGVWFRIGLSVFAALQFWSILTLVRDRFKAAASAQKLENELLQNRVYIMLSQIQPHFLYNALNAIQYLCETQPQAASGAVEHFAKYLRGNMDSLTKNVPITFSEELRHLDNYLYIEKLRFSKLKVEYNINADGFKLPALTVQPLVENAIRYGVTRKPGCGTVTVSTFEDEKNWFVVISDDGVGFDPMKTQYDGRSHIGITNTRGRLASMCGGTLEIDSRPGEGTIVTIKLPKDWKFAASEA